MKFRYFFKTTLLFALTVCLIFLRQTQGLSISEYKTEEGITPEDSHYCELNYRIFYHKNLPGFQKLSDLKHRKVAIFKYGHFAEYLKRELGDDFYPIEIENEADFIENIKKHRVKIFVVSESIGFYFIKKAGMQDGFLYSTEPVYTAIFRSRGAKKEQPRQIRTPVQYDPGLSDPFFDSNEWSYPWWIIIRDDGSFEDTTGEITDLKDAPRLKHTANCITKYKGEHTIRFSRAKLYDDGTIDILIHDDSASTNDKLKIEVKNGYFSCQYWTTHVADRGDEDVIWTTKKQKLVLQKKEYRKGDILRGKIEFECLQEVTNPKYGARYPRIIRIEGVFKPELK